MSKLYFFCHAQASYGAENYDQLSQKGEEQSAQLGAYLVNKNIHFDRIFIGPLKRQQHTFEIVREAYLNENRSLPQPIILNNLKEHQGPEALQQLLPDLQNSDEIIRNWHQEILANPALKKRNSMLIFQYFLENWFKGNFVAKDLEPWSIFHQNVKEGLTTIFDSIQKGEQIGVFTSGGTISSITAKSLNLELEARIAALNFSIRNTSFTTFFHSKNQFNLLSFNELPHLEDNLITFV